MHRRGLPPLGPRVFVVLAACLVLLAIGARTARPEVYWGAYVAGGQYGRTDAPWDMRSADAFERRTGKRLSLIEWAQDWYECSSSCAMRGFRADLLQKVRDRGAIPVLSWGSYAENRGLAQHDYRLSEIVDGRYDGFIRRWARGAARWGHPFFLRFDWEMNTDSVPYSEQLNGNRPGEFAAMWRHVHDIFTQVGATNATWVWCPNVEYEGSEKPLAALYPGDRYVDWTCMDGYNWGRNPVRPAGWRTPAEIFGPTYDLITTSIAPSKPVMIGETASTEVGGSKSRWIGQLLQLPGDSRFSKVRAVVWFNKRWDRMDWPIESSGAARAAFARGIGHRRYAGNGFRRIKASPIGSP